MPSPFFWQSRTGWSYLLRFQHILFTCNFANRKSRTLFLTFARQIIITLGNEVAYYKVVNDSLGQSAVVSLLNVFQESHNFKLHPGTRRTFRTYVKMAATGMLSRFLVCWLLSWRNLMFILVVTDNLVVFISGIRNNMFYPIFFYVSGFVFELRVVNLQFFSK